jgi:predicted transcriptional regulator
MQDPISEIAFKVQKHEMQLTGMERMMNEGLIEQRQLVRELHEMTSSFKVYIERHDQVNASNKKVWALVEKQADSITDLQRQAATNQPVIDAIRTLNSKIIWLVISALATPAAIVGYVATQGGL